MADKLPSLNVLSGPLAGHKFVIEDAVDNILIGSDPSCGFVLETPGVSPIHARLWVDLNGATVYDTNSPAGVYVNDDRVVKEAPVRNGDILWLGPPGAEGSVLIQCILPLRDEVGEPKPADADSEVDTSAATLAFAVPTVDEPERPSSERGSFVGRDYDESEADATVVMPSSAPMGTPMEREPPPVPEPDPTDATLLLDAADDLDAVEETVAMPPPVPTRAQPPPVPEPVADVFGFPDFDVEPTVGMAPPPLPPKPTPPPPAPVAEFEDELEPTMVDAPRPGGTLPPPVPDRDLSEDDGASAAMFRAADVPPPVPPPAAAPPPPSTPPRAVAPSPAEAPAPSSPPVAPKPAAPPPARPPAEAKPAPRAIAPAVTARPASPPVRAKVERSAVVPPAAAAPPPVARGGGSSRGPLIAAAAVVVAALAFAAYWFTRPAAPEVAEATPAPAPPETQPAPPVTQAAAPGATEPPPVTQAAALPETLPPAPVAATTPPPATVKSPPPSPRVAVATPAVPPGQKPPVVPPGQRPPVAATPPPVSAAQQTAATITSLMGQARTAADAKNYDAAVAMYDEVLKLDPQNGPASAARTAALGARSASRKTFVSSRTVVQTEQKSKGPAGFDTSDVSVKSQDFIGRLEFAMNPATVKPGEPYKLQIALVNEGKKAIKISGMTFTVTVNGQKSGNPIAPRVKEVAPSQRVVLEELPGMFPESVNTWMAEVLVTANKGDSLRNQITWR